MSSLSGQTVATGQTSQPPRTDLDCLLDYMEQRFMAHRGEILDRVADVEQFKGRQETVVLGFRTLRFIAELDGWIEIASKLIASDKGTELGTSREFTAEQTGGRRPLSDEVKARAAASLAPLQMILGTLKATRDTMKNVVRFVESTQQFLRAQEFGELFSQDFETPSELYDAPLAETIASVRRR